MIREGLINSSVVIPAHAGIQYQAENKQLDSGSTLRFAWNDELIRASLGLKQELMIVLPFFMLAHES